MEHTFAIYGMFCANCSHKIKQSIELFDFVDEMIIDRDASSGCVESSSVLQEDQLVAIAQKIVSLGDFQVKVGNRWFPKSVEASGASTRSKIYSVGINGMTCSTCSLAIEKGLSKLEGVESCVVSLMTETAQIRYDPSLVQPEALVDHIEALGFEAEPHVSEEEQASVMDEYREYVLLVKKGEITDAIIQQVNEMHSGIELVVVRQPLRLTVRIGANCVLKLRDIVWSLEHHGIETGLHNKYQDFVEQMKSSHTKVLRYWRNLVLFCCIFAIPTLFLSMIAPYIPNLLKVSGLTAWIPSTSASVMSLILWALCTPVQFYAGRVFFRDAYYAFLRGSSNMATLVVLGTMAAYIYSIMSVLVALTTKPDNHSGHHGMGDEHFFETSTTLITIVVLGKYLECLAKGKTSESLSKLLELQTPTASLCRIGENMEILEETIISSELLEVDDIVKVVPGASFPSDGVIIKGNTHINEAMITGESMPVSKTVDDLVIGTTINQEGVVLVRVSQIGEDSMLAQILELMKNAQMSRPQIQKFTDTVSSYFVPFVVSVAVLTFVVWISLAYSHVIDHLLDARPPLFALRFSIAVLVIACPCALGLATPTAIMVASGVGAANGLLLKSGRALESLARVTTILFDKTGTLTNGTPKVTDVYFIPSRPLEITEETLFRWCFAAEQGSEHVLAKCIVSYVEERFPNRAPVALGKISYHIGMGLECIVEQTKTLYIGNDRLMKLKQIPIPADVSAKLEQMEIQGKTAICVAVDNQVQMLLGLADSPREEARDVIWYLQNRLGIDVWMITGDNRRAATYVASQLGIVNVLAEALPQSKHAHVVELQKKSRRIVAFVGDGVNDSPAQAAADVGIAVGSGTDIAISASDVVLMSSNLKLVPNSVELGRATLQRIRLNLVLALIFNSLGIPIAAGVFYPWIHQRLPPEFAAIAMSLSSVTVVCSALLFRRFRPREIEPAPEVVVINMKCCDICTCDNRGSVSRLRLPEEEQVSFMEGDGRTPLLSNDSHPSGLSLMNVVDGRSGPASCLCECATCGCCSTSSTKSCCSK